MYDDITIIINCFSNDFSRGYNDPVEVTMIFVVVIVSNAKVIVISM